MKLNEDTKATGQVVITLRGPDGKIKDRTCINNLVVTGGRAHIADQLAAKSQQQMSHMALGTGSTVQDYSDTALEAELNRKVLKTLVNGSGADANKVIYTCDWPTGEADGAIAEAGLFNATSAGTMLCRTTFPVKNKGPGDALTLTWTLTITG